MKKINYKYIKEILETEKARKILKTGAALAGAAGLALIVSALVVNSLLGRIIHSRPEVVIPDIEGMELNQALDLLAETNLSLLKVAEKYDSTIPSGSIISQTPPPGLSVRQGRAVEAVISSGGQVVFVPDLIGVS
ncbi:MAG: PASTA domain-containing protein, partial [Elusimicrobia bacterium]|nr:PASTA domain-containing protein [Elusimicrobiota bacterium]